MSSERVFGEYSGRKWWRVEGGLKIYLGRRGPAPSPHPSSLALEHGRFGTLVDTGRNARRVTDNGHYVNLPVARDLASEGAVGVGISLDRWSRS